MQLLITSHLIAAKRKASTVDVPDVQRAYSLFYDQKRSVEYVEKNEREFITGKEFEDGNVNGNEGLVPMQDVQA